MSPLEFSCSCGKLHGHIDGKAVSSGAHVVCYCRDCRAAHLYLNQPDPAPGPVDLFATTPDAITIVGGAENLGLLRLSPRGTMRWYATCCDSPLFSTGSGPKIPFVSVQQPRIATPDRLGPVIGKAFMPKPGGKTAHVGFGRLVWKLLPGILGARLSGRWRKTPFFNVETGEPVATAKIPSKEDRAALYPSAP